MRPMIRFFLNIRFKSKLLLSYLIVVLIPIMTWVMYSFHQTNGFIAEQTKTNFQNIVLTTYSNLGQKMSKIENSFELITQDTTMIQIINGQYASNYDKYYDIVHKFDPMINALQMMNPEIKKINIFTNGDIKNARGIFMDLASLRDKFTYLSVVDTIEPVWIFEDGKLHVVKQVLSLENVRESAIVSLEIDPALIFKNNVALQFQNYGMLIADGNGTIVYQEDHLVRTATGGSLKEVLADLQSNSNIILFKQNTYPKGWDFYMYMDTQSHAISINSAFKSTIFIVLVSVVLIFIVSMLFSRTFVRRITKLNRLLSGVVADGFETNIKSDFKDEIGEITNSIGAVVKQTRQLIDEVHSSHTQQRDSELKALQSQINPHFLYNTLSTINWQAIQSGNSDISKLAISLSSFYRSTLNKGNMVTTVQYELENIRAYLDIQLSISRHSFNVIYEIEDHILEYNMPNIILQPVVENAVEHGLVSTMNSGDGLIIIRAYESGNDILFEVIDNGGGISEETIRDVLIHGKKGFGLKNVDNRLKLYFDQEYGLSFHSMEPHGTKATIRIPKYVEI
ncbi:sensor histidine kinase [Paenibacillus sp. CF384]|uniref:sensor histidine kinase n=1 Tax=Paenibacillus sp. CF384 TaxID=1884382 RepID=UPI000894610B|nr:histidine kinase [Paenibacillus sp. CF384]SDW71596.1 two-component system, sensor histidine kinase YesM [Paenibacillus sp. CF384]